MNFNPDYLDIDERVAFAKQLVSTIEHLPTPFSLALDAPWGAGKTRFLREPFREEARKKFNIVIYDAFEHETDGEPFLSITSQIIRQATELSTLHTTDDFPSKIQAVKQNASNVFLKSLPMVKRLATSMAMKAFTGHTADQLEDLLNLEENQLEDVNENITAEALKVIEHYLESSDRTECVKEQFRTSLSNLCSAGMTKTLIIIDELDRCTPSHALKVLESIKHLLLTDNTIFLFSYNKNQICNSVRHIYGEADADAYLRKFIQIEVAFPINKNNDRSYLRTFIVQIAKKLQLKNNELSAPSFSALTTVLKLQLRDIESIMLTGFRILKVNAIDDSDITAMWLLICIHHYNRKIFSEIFIESNLINTETQEKFISKLRNDLDKFGTVTHNILYVTDTIVKSKEIREKHPKDRFYRNPEYQLLELAKMIIAF